jgi:hypothetical protein
MKLYICELLNRIQILFPFKKMFSEKNGKSNRLLTR